MELLAILISVAALLLSGLSIYLSWRQFKKSGPMITAYIVSGGIDNPSGRGFFIDSNAHAMIELPECNSRYEKVPHWDEYPLWGVHVVNKGRSSITVRAVYPELTFTRDEKWARILTESSGVEYKVGERSTQAQQARPEEFVHGPQFPAEIKGGADEYWFFSAIKFRQNPFRHDLNFAVQLGDSTTVRTSLVPVERFSDEEAQRVLGSNALPRAD